MGPLLRAVNAIAAAVEPEFPHVAIDTLAYQYTRAAPRVTVPRPNVIVRYDVAVWRAMWRHRARCLQHGALGAGCAQSNATLRCR